MFNVVSTPTFTRDVTIHVPSGDDFKEESLKATFVVLSDDEKGNADLTTPEDVKDFLRKAIVSLGDLVDEDGKPVTYSPAILEGLIGLGYVRIALLTTYTRAQVKALTGN